MAPKLAADLPMHIVLRTIAVASAGGWLFSYLQVPLAWLLGALAITVLTIGLFGYVHIPRLLRDMVSPVLGVLIGSSFTPALAAHIANWPAGIAIVLAYAAFITAAGFLYFRYLARFDSLTAFFAGLPGGLSEMTLVGISLGAKVSALAVVHSIRIVAIVVTVPILIGVVFHRMPAASPAFSGHSLGLADALILVACGGIGFGLSHFIRIPAGPLFLPLILSAAVHLTGAASGAPPPWIVSAAQVIIGAYIGARFMGVAFRHALILVIHGLVWAAIIISVAVGVALLAGAHIAGTDGLALMLALAPGGMSEMSLLTLAVGVEVAFVSTCHLMRMFAVFLLAPIIARFLPSPMKTKQTSEDNSDID